jgi:hypothetical protein
MDWYSGVKMRFFLRNAGGRRLPALVATGVVKSQNIEKKHDELCRGYQ